jgi:hypothetical protein
MLKLVELIKLSFQTRLQYFHWVKFNANTNYFHVLCYIPCVTVYKIGKKNSKPGYQLFFIISQTAPKT